MYESKRQHANKLLEKTKTYALRATHDGIELLNKTAAGDEHKQQQLQKPWHRAVQQVPVVKQPVGLVHDKVLHSGQVYAAFFDECHKSLQKTVRSTNKTRQ
jgi:hypothetical protein